MASLSHTVSTVYNTVPETSLTSRNICVSKTGIWLRPFLQVSGEKPYPGEWQCRPGWRSAPPCSGRRSGRRPRHCRRAAPRSRRTHRPWCWGCWCCSWAGSRHRWSRWAGGTNPASAGWTLRAGHTPLRCYLLEEGRQVCSHMRPLRSQPAHACIQPCRLEGALLITKVNSQDVPYFVL